MTDGHQSLCSIDVFTSVGGILPETSPVVSQEFLLYLCPFFLNSLKFYFVTYSLRLLLCNTRGRFRNVFILNTKYHRIHVYPQFIAMLV
jgi:hypothetical protein